MCLEIPEFCIYTIDTEFHCPEILTSFFHGVYILQEYCNEHCTLDFIHSRGMLKPKCTLQLINNE